MMEPVFAIYKKDMKALFTNPMFYILTGFCCCLWGIFYSIQVYAFVQKSYQITLNQQATVLNIHQNLISTYLVVVHYVLVFIIAALSIRFFAEEKKLKTFPILLSSPVTSWQIVLAKWFMGVTLVFTLLFISALYPLSLLFFTKLPLGLFFLGYLGTFVVLCVFMSAAMLASSVTESLIVCVVLSLVFNVLLLMLGMGRELTETLYLQEFFSFLSFDQHYTSFRSGIFSLSSLLYFLSWSGLLALLTERVVEFHRWR